MDEIIGMVKLFAGTYEVRGFMFCDGRKLPISLNLNSPLTTQNLTLNYEVYDYGNVVVSENFY